MPSLKNVGYMQHNTSLSQGFKKEFHSDYRGAVNIDKGETVEVTEEQAKYLLKNYGAAFEVVKDSSAAEDAAAAKAKADADAKAAAAKVAADKAAADKAAAEKAAKAGA